MSLKRHDIIVILLGRLGDTLVALPALHALRAEHPESRVTLLCQYGLTQSGAGPDELLRNSGLIDVIARDIVDAPLLSRTIERLRLLVGLHKRWKCAYILVPPHPPCSPQLLRRLARFAWLCGAREIHHHEQPLHFRYEKGQLLPLPRVTDSLLELFPARAREKVPSRVLQIHESEEEAAREILEEVLTAERPIIAVAPASNMNTKEWAPDRFAAVMQHFASQGVRSVVLGSESDGSVLSSIAQEVEGAKVICGQKIEVVAAAISCCTLYLGNDTGLMHLAAAVGVPCVAIFSGRDAPGAWAPYGGAHQILRHRVHCEGCMLEQDCPNELICLNGISVEAVIDACAKLLKEGTTN